MCRGAESLVKIGLARSSATLILEPNGPTQPDGSLLLQTRVSRNFVLLFHLHTCFRQYFACVKRISQINFLCNPLCYTLFLLIACARMALLSHVAAHLTTRN